MRAIVFALAIMGSPPRSEASEKQESWVDTNFVPCEGMGLNASGRIGVHVDYRIEGKVIEVSSFLLTTSYQFEHEPTAQITFTGVDGATAKFNLQTPWFATVGPDDGTKALYLPRSGDGDTDDAQTHFRMKPGTPIKISSTARFPQEGGNCFSTFDSRIVLP
ncbi:hypothetical protein EN850_02940 [Mesorhizobium sp. M8A.F.Ca.ET.207.01.1.1]|uniref:hypothetical protein n=1 Tax=Mesorhizobium sp. M8A.F.Ca.ET.207.01.1.1 TaxID=2563968 RepID=UPI00109D27D3|nr:hypothetical protein [Mesorhizobium sp. M8A.F.Ca.ET.207.01.1.1]TGQ83715.1 hypothetical protein EN850_02940 [Mesorhizobium sp. M8A.F.Ca.ET.207.01.1.1]